VNTSPPSRLTPAQAEALGARFALKVSARLDDGTKALPHDITERLRVARQTAVEAARLAQGAALARPAAEGTANVMVGVSVAGAGTGGVTINLGSGVARGHSRDTDHGRHLDDAPPSWGWRVASVLPLLVLLAGLWGINAWYQREQVQAAAEVDMALLSDDLPPAAYADPGFEEYLRTQAADQSRTLQDQSAREDTAETPSRVDAAVSDLPADQAMVPALAGPRP
jgi:Protein of unknown function (DUF3619)